MTRCECCGEQFSPMTAWEFDMCGQCMATQIEFELLKMSGGLHRMPAMRSSGPGASGSTVPTPVERRQA